MMTTKSFQAKQLIDQAEQAILHLTDTEKFQAYLRTLAKFHEYSSRNISLIYAQDPRASRLAGFKSWQRDFNRTVMPGAKAIRIAAPLMKKLTPAEQQRWHTTDKLGIIGYRFLPVFDIQQTKGEHVLQAQDFVQENLQNHANITNFYKVAKDYLANQGQLNISERVITEVGVHGYFLPATNEIVIDQQQTDSAFKLRTLFHEYAHSQLHGLRSEFKDRPRAYQEAQAEAVAYVVMAHLGLNTGSYSLGYVATWVKDKAVIHQALSEIQVVSNKTLTISDNLTKRLGLQQTDELTQQLLPSLSQLTSNELNRNYLSLQAQIKHANNQIKKEPLQHQLSHVTQEISNRTQKQLKRFVKQSPETTQTQSKNKIRQEPSR